MAKPVQPVSRTPSGHVSVKSEQSSRRSSVASGMAASARPGSSQGSQGDCHISSAVPASSSRGSRRSPHTVASSSAAAASTSRPTTPRRNK